MFVKDLEYFINLFPMCFGFIPSGQYLGDMIHLLNSTAGISGNNTITDAIQSCTEPFFAFAHRFFGALALGDITRDSDHSDVFTGIIFYNRCPKINRKLTAVFPAVDEFSAPLSR